MKTFALRFTQYILPGLTALTIAMGAVSTYAVDLSSVPLTTSTATAVRPNLNFVLDDSGSMGLNYMPDYAGEENLCKNSTSWNATTCTNGDPPFANSDFNGIYYNPNLAYPAPVNGDGSFKPDQVRTAVRIDPFNSSSTSTINLETSFPDSIWCTKNSPNTTEIGDASKPTSTVCRRNGVAYTVAPVVSANYNYPIALTRT